jgi:hypothetical protein
MNLTLSAVYEEVPESEGGGYVAYTEELPGAISEGDTLDEARKNLPRCYRGSCWRLIVNWPASHIAGKQLPAKRSRFP